MHCVLVVQAILIATSPVYWRLQPLYFLFVQNVRMNLKFALAPEEAERSWNMGSQRQAAKLPLIESTQPNKVAEKEKVNRSVVTLAC